MGKMSYILIRFETRGKVVSAFQFLKENEIETIDVLSPVPIEELDSIMPERKSFIGGAGLIAGLFGFAAVLYFQLWVSGKAYPLFYGGKPFDAWLSFVPVLFESIVLLASLIIVITFLFEIRIFSKKIKLPDHLKFTNDEFAIILNDDSVSESKKILLNDNFELEKIEI